MLRIIRHLSPYLYLALTLIIMGYGFLSPQYDNFHGDGKISADSLQQAQDSFFSKVNFYNSKNQLPFLHLDSDELTISGGSKDIFFSQPKGVLYTKEQRPVNYQGQQGIFKDATQILILTNEVLFKDKESQINANKLTYNIAEETVFAKGNVKSKMHSLKTAEDILIDANEMRAFMANQTANYQGQVKGHIKRKRVYEQTVYFKTDKLYLDLNLSKVSLDGNVFVKKEGITAESLRGEIFLENYNKSLKYYVLYDDVRLIEKLNSPDGKNLLRRGFSEKLEGIINEDKIVLTGYPKVFQGQDIIKGNRITIRENNEIVEVDDASSNFELK